MKKRRFWLIIIAIAMSVCMILSIVACSENGKVHDAEENKNEIWSIARLYALAQENGFDGTFEDFVAIFKGDKGNQGTQGDQCIQGDQGEQGIQGDKGEKR
ncbi:MAG: hypothetical protein J1G02_06420 [Clostridiales bacterium]|nr:hypothetical protein [Clostridiales bacterium]